MSVVNMVVGATTPDGATFAAKVDGGGPVRVAVALDQAMTTPVFTASQAVDAQGVAKVSISGLDPSTRYWWQTEDNAVLDDTFTGQFLTHPQLGVPASFTIGAAACASGAEFPAGAGVFVDFIGTETDLSEQTVYAFPGVNIGTAAADRLVVAVVHAEAALPESADSATIGGGAADRPVHVAGNGLVAMFTRVVPSGSTADIVVTLSGPAVRCQLGIWTVTGWGSQTPFATDTASQLGGTGLAMSVDVPFLGAGIAAQTNRLTGAMAWAGATERYDDAVEANVQASGADVQSANAERLGHSITTSYADTGGQENVAIAAVWAPSTLVPSRLSNAPVFDTIRQRALTGDWLMFAHLGDLHYYNLGQTTAGFPAGTLANYRRSYDDVLAQPNQRELYNQVAWAYVWDDHDYGPDNSDGTFPDKANAQQVFRERAPHYDLDNADAIYQSFQIGRVLFIMSDTRSDRSPNSTPDGPAKTMLGAAQKTWLTDLLANTTAEALVWLMPSVWKITSGADTWASFATERDELVGILDQGNWLDRMVMVYGDRHALGIDSGATNTWGGFPVLQAASMDSDFGSPIAGLYDVVPDTPGRNQYGTIAVNDTGLAIGITLAAWNGNALLGSYTHSINFPAPPAPALPDVTALLSGSHRATFEARVLTTFQTGGDPDGTEIPILGGDVQYDATAEIFATLSLTTSGISETDRKSLFPRRAGDLLAPYGREVFVRRGIDLGSHIVWVPLGYFRLDTDEQSPASDDPIQLQAQDRMSAIVDGRLIRPRVFSPDRSIASVVDELVHDIYPIAVVLFDDASGQQALGRQLVVEEDRYQALLDIARSLGKVMFWDGEGFLRINDAPDPDTISWELKAGRDGVLTDSGRRVGREGMHNGVVARGEGGDSKIPVEAIAVDNGVNSPTRWFPPDDETQLWFGQVPKFFSSPVLTTPAMVRKAAASLLRRYIGMPFSVDFGSVVNPSLRPRDVVRITQKDGNREKHIVEMCTVPLSASVRMTGSTREQSLVKIQIGDEDFEV